MIRSVLAHITLMVVYSPILFGIIAKTKALFAGRRGAPLLQPYYDIVKLLRKAGVYSPTVNWTFRMAPAISLAAIMAAGLLMPMGGLAAPIQFWGDAILFVYLFGLSRFFIILAAMDTGSSLEGMGASREATLACLSEVTVFLNLAVLALVSKSVSLSNMIGGGMALSWHVLGPVLCLVIISFFLILLTENTRIPVDDPATHLELTMIHEVMVLDHSGVDLAYIMCGQMIKLYVLGSFLIPIVIPLKNGGAAIDTIIFGAGLAGVAVVIGVVESITARLRLQRVAYLLILAFILAMFAFIVTLLRGR